MFDFLKHIITGRQLLLAAAISPVLLSGCINEEGTCPDGVSGGSGTWLSMRVVNADSRQGRTRADADGHPDEAATDPENYIDGSDMTIMLLDNRKMVRHIFAPEEITLSPAGSGNDAYDLKFKLNSDYFSYAGSMSSVDFSLMVVANRTGLGGETSVFGTDMLSLKPWMIAERYPSFTMPAQTSAAWMPNSGTNRIPMSGIMTATGIDLSVTNTADKPLNVGTVTLQRNLCKVRILDDLNGLDGGSEYDRITSVKLVGANGKGAFIPLLPETDPWYTNTTALETPTVEASWWNAGSEVTMLNAPQTSVVNSKDGNYTWQNAYYCYVPEAALTGNGAKLVITANYDDDPDRTREWNLSLDQTGTGENAGYTGTPSFVRNHIYEYLVQAVSGAKLTLTLNVVDWESQTVTWDYSDNPGVADGGWLTWLPEELNGATVNTETARLVFSQNQNNAATGTFQFSQPIGGVWTASFAPIGDTEAEAFCFVADDSSLVSTISGPISESVKSTIKIRPRFAPRSSQRSAQLVFTVRTPDGRTLTGDLVEAEGIKHFTVVQNRQ